MEDFFIWVDEEISVENCGDQSLASREHDIEHALTVATLKDDRNGKFSDVFFIFLIVHIV